MPYVNIRVAGELSTDQKDEMCQGVTKVISRVSGKPPESILIFIDECDRENVSSGGVLLSKNK